MKVSQRLPKVQKQVDALEAAGYSVRLKHDAVRTRSSAVTIHNGDDIVVGLGFSTCSEADNFDKAIGTEVAFRRAVNNFYKIVGHRTVRPILNPGNRGFRN
jgi:2,3-bisphosphoglycerate-independent phosphoglycerate mutase